MNDDNGQNIGDGSENTVRTQSNDEKYPDSRTAGLKLWLDKQSTRHLKMSWQTLSLQTVKRITLQSL